jgi:ABC-type sugar transport system ATPase subunit
MTSVTLRGVHRRYGAPEVLRDLSLDVGSGEFVVLLGPSGCGKSTLLSVIAGIEECDSGRVLIGARDVTGLPPKDRDIAMVFQSYALYPTMTARENLSFALKMARLPRAQVVERVQWAASLLGLEGLLGRKPSQLSGGERQRVAIGRAIVRRAAVYLFDEPLSNLDAALRAGMRDEMRQLHERLGATTLYVTHDQTEAMTMATRIALMRDGRIEQSGAPRELYERPRTRYAAEFLGSPAMNLVPARLARLDGRWTVATSSARFSLTGYAFVDGAEALHDGQPVWLGVRPEDLRLAAGDRLCDAATVQAVELLGPDSVVWVRGGGERLALRCARERAPSRGDTMAIGLERSRISLFDRATGLRI